MNTRAKCLIVIAGIALAMVVMGTLFTAGLAIAERHEWYIGTPLRWYLGTCFAHVAVWSFVVGIPSSIAIVVTILVTIPAKQHTHRPPILHRRSSGDKSTRDFLGNLQ